MASDRKISKTETPSESRPFDVEDCRYLLRTLELDAYHSVLAAMRAQGPLNDYKRQVLDHVRVALQIPWDRHKAEIQAVVHDKLLQHVCSCLNPSIHTESEWLEESRAWPDNFASIEPKKLRPSRSVKKSQQPSTSELRADDIALSIAEHNQKISRLDGVMTTERRLTELVPESVRVLSDQATQRWSSLAAQLTKAGLSVHDVIVGTQPAVDVVLGVDKGHGRAKDTPTTSSNRKRAAPCGGAKRQGQAPQNQVRPPSPMAQVVFDALEFLTQRIATGATSSTQPEEPPCTATERTAEMICPNGHLGTVPTTIVDDSEPGTSQGHVTPQKECNIGSSALPRGRNTRQKSKSRQKSPAASPTGAASVAVAAQCARHRTYERQRQLLQRQAGGKSAPVLAVGVNGRMGEEGPDIPLSPSPSPWPRVSTSAGASPCHTTLDDNGASFGIMPATVTQGWHASKYSKWANQRRSAGAASGGRGGFRPISSAGSFGASPPHSDAGIANSVLIDSTHSATGSSDAGSSYAGGARPLSVPPAFGRANPGAAVPLQLHQQQTSTEGSSMAPESPLPSATQIIDCVQPAAQRLASSPLSWHSSGTVPSASHGQCNGHLPDEGSVQKAIDVRRHVLTEQT